MREWVPWIGLAVRLIAAGIWLAAGISKVVELETFRTQVAKYDLLPHALVTPFAYVLPFVEIGIGVYLALGLFVRAAAAVACVLMVLFVIAQAQAWARGLVLDCGCFGSITHAAGRLLVDRPRRRARDPEPDRADLAAAAALGRRGAPRAARPVHGAAVVRLGRATAALTAAALAAPAAAAAHGDEVPVSRLSSAWDAQPVVLAIAGLMLLLFAQAFWRLRRRGRADHAPWTRVPMFVAAVAHRDAAARLAARRGRRRLPALRAHAPARPDRRRRAGARARRAARAARPLLPAAVRARPARAGRRRCAARSAS